MWNLVYIEIIDKRGGDMNLLMNSVTAEQAFLVIEMSATGYDFNIKRRLVVLSMPAHEQEYLLWSDVKRLKDIPGGQVLTDEVVTLASRFAKGRYAATLRKAQELAQSTIAQEKSIGFLFPQVFNQEVYA